MRRLHDRETLSDLPPRGRTLSEPRPLAAPSDSTQGFIIGGSKPIVGSAVLVGRRLPSGEHAPARTSSDDVRSMVRWTTVERIVKPVPPSKVRAIVIDPESRSIDETVMAATVPSLEALIGAPPLLYFRVRDGNLYGASVLSKTVSLWRKEDFVFPGRVVIVGVAEDETHMLDRSINLEMLRNTVKFSVAGSEEWAATNRQGPRLRCSSKRTLAQVVIELRSA